MSDLFLDDDELYELTGKMRSDAQIRVLRSEGVPFIANAAGAPRVLRAYLAKRLGATDREPECEPTTK